MSTTPAVVVRTSETFLLTKNTTYDVIGNNISLCLIEGSGDHVNVMGRGDTVTFENMCLSPSISVAAGRSMTLNILGPVYGSTSVSGWTSKDHLNLLEYGPPPDPFGIMKSLGGTMLTNVPCYAAGVVGIKNTGDVMFFGASISRSQITETFNNSTGLAYGNGP